MEAHAKTGFDLLGAPARIPFCLNTIYRIKQISTMPKQTLIKFRSWQGTSRVVRLQCEVAGMVRNG
jgi:hypothetical protein